MRKMIIIPLVPLLVIAAATVGLATAMSERYYDTGVFTFTILGGYSIEVIGDYDYGAVDPADTTPVARTVTARAWCNVDTYTINVRAGGQVMLGGLPAADLTLNNFEYTGPTGATALTLMDALWFSGTRTIQTDHPAELRLTNRAGGETPGTYTTTVVFTMVAP